MPDLLAQLPQHKYSWPGLADEAGARLSWPKGVGKGWESDETSAAQVVELLLRALYRAPGSRAVGGIAMLLERLQAAEALLPALPRLRVGAEALPLLPALRSLARQGLVVAATDLAEAFGVDEELWLASFSDVLEGRTRRFTRGSGRFRAWLAGFQGGELLGSHLSWLKPQFSEVEFSSVLEAGNDLWSWDPRRQGGMAFKIARRSRSMAMLRNRAVLHWQRLWLELREATWLRRGLRCRWDPLTQALHDRKRFKTLDEGDDSWLKDDVL